MATQTGSTYISESMDYDRQYGNSNDQSDVFDDEFAEISKDNRKWQISFKTAIFSFPVVGRYSLLQLPGYIFLEIAVVKTQICRWNFDAVSSRGVSISRFGGPLLFPVVHQYQIPLSMP